MTDLQFNIKIDKWLEKAGNNANAVLRKAALDIFSRVVLRSPVLTGRFRSNWNISLGQPSTKVTFNTDPSGTKALQLISETVAQSRVGDQIFLCNALPYSRRIEFGWSKQAPAGVVGITVREWNAVVEKAANQTPK